MTKADAERLTIAEWRKLPLQERQARPGSYICYACVRHHAASLQLSLLRGQVSNH
jgi:hypothetical protein